MILVFYLHKYIPILYLFDFSPVQGKTPKRLADNDEDMTPIVRSFS